VREVDPLGPEFTYLQVANDIATRIKAGEITHKLPAERQLAEEYGVAYQTVRHSMAILRDRGLIITRQGRGTFVNPGGSTDAAAAATADGPAQDGSGAGPESPAS
jgi:GntR family transcriptional regulator